MDLKKNILETVREDDFVEYFIFPQIEATDEKQQETHLNAILNKAGKIIEKFTKNYMWHKDQFKLNIRTSLSNILSQTQEENEKLPPHLYGVSHYGDNIEDEWFMVFLLVEITKEINGSIAKIHDADGEFLLIESANFLPTWANPETCQNRVCLYNGKVHLLPPEDLDDPSIAISQAISQIWSNPTEYMASQDIQNSIRNKISKYPDSIKDNLHHAVVLIPTAIAAILKQKPNLIAPAVQAFCNRDPVDLKACRAMKYFPPEQRVKSMVKFTKCLYAMLLHSKYVPDRRTGWNLPGVNDPEYKMQSLGVRIACGFEILVSQAKPSAEIEGDRGWEHYIKNLKEKGYFRDLLEHSKDYNYLLNKAKEYYINHRDSMQYSPAIGQEILELLRSVDVNYEQLKKEGENLPKDDSDSWLDISSEELDKMLQEKYGQRKIVSVNNNTEAGGFVEKVNNFLNHVSDFTGAEFPENHGQNGESPIKPPRRKSKGKVSFANDTKNKSENTKTNNKINFDPNSFACAVTNILNFMIPEDDSWDLDSDSDMSEYENDSYVKNETAEPTKNKMEQYMADMDRELAATTIGQSFEKKKKTQNGEKSTFEDIEDFDPVDIDMNALKNILESYKSQLGEAGPSSNMLGPMGIHLDPKD